MENNDDPTESVMQSEAFEPRFQIRLTILALVLGLSVEILFHGHPLGISFPIWAGLSVAALLIAAWWGRIRPARAELWLAIPIMFFASMTFLRLEPLTTFLNVIIVLALLAIWVRIFRSGKLIDYGWVDYLVALVRVPLEAWYRPWSILRTSWIKLVGERGAKDPLIAVLRGILLALPILVVFAALLTAADLIFADYVETALSWLNIELLAEYIGRMLVIIISAIFLLGALAVSLSDPGERRLIGHDQPIISPFLGFIETAVILGAVNLLFAVFVIVQFTYIFGGEVNITVTGYTYAEYARRGFGELTAVAFLSLGLIIAMGALSRREGKRRAAWFHGLSAVLVGLVGVILVSAFKRLLLYENAYGFTRLRTYTHVAILWMGILFVLFLPLLIKGRLRRFALAAAFGVLGFAATLNLANVDSFIVRQNMERFIDTGLIDVEYLTRLSDDAVPELIRLAEIASEQVEEEMLPQLACRQAEISNYISRTSWQSFHWSRASGERLLSGVEESFRDYEVKLVDGLLVVEGPEGEQACDRWRGWD